MEKNFEDIQAAVNFAMSRTAAEEIPERIRPTFPISVAAVTHLEGRVRETVLRNLTKAEVAPANHFVERMTRIGLNLLLEDATHPRLKKYLADFRPNPEPRAWCIAKYISKLRRVDPREPINVQRVAAVIDDFVSRYRHITYPLAGESGWNELAFHAAYLRQEKRRWRQKARLVRKFGLKPAENGLYREYWRDKL